MANNYKIKTPEEFDEAIEYAEQRLAKIDNEIKSITQIKEEEKARIQKELKQLQQKKIQRSIKNFVGTDELRYVLVLSWHEGSAWQDYSELHITLAESMPNTAELIWHQTRLKFRPKECFDAAEWLSSMRTLSSHSTWGDYHLALVPIWYDGQNKKRYIEIRSALTEQQYNDLVNKMLQLNSSPDAPQVLNLFKEILYMPDLQLYLLDNKKVGALLSLTKTKKDEIIKIITADRAKDEKRAQELRAGANPDKYQEKGTTKKGSKK